MSLRLSRGARTGGISFRLREDMNYLCFKFREIQGQHRTPRVQNQIASLRQQVEMTAQRLAHAALDAIAFVRFTQYFAGGESHAWRRVPFTLGG